MNCGINVVFVVITTIIGFVSNGFAQETFVIPDDWAQGIHVDDANITLGLVTLSANRLTEYDRIEMEFISTSDGFSIWKLSDIEVNSSAVVWNVELAHNSSKVFNEDVTNDLAVQTSNGNIVFDGMSDDIGDFHFVP